MSHPLDTVNLVCVRTRQFGTVLLLALMNCVIGPQQQPGSVAGLVYDAASRVPLGGVTVRIVGANEAVTTDTTGAFFLSGVPIGEAVLHFAAQHRTPAIVSVRVGNGQALFVDDTVYLSWDYGIIAGLVSRDDSLTPLGGATVIVKSAESNIPVDSAETDSNGLFAIQHLAPNAAGYSIEINREDFGGEILSQPLLAGDSIFQSVSLKPFLTISGSVLDNASSAPLENAIIRGGTQEARSDSLGQFTIDSLVASDTGCLFTVLGEYYEPTSRRDTLRYGTATMNPIRVQRSKGSLKGTIHLQGQVSHSGIRVYLNETGVFDTTDELGEIEITDIPAGRHVIEIGKPNFATTIESLVIPGQGIARMEVELAIESGTIQTRAEWVSNTTLYRVVNHIDVADGGTLYVAQGVSIQMANGSTLGSSGNGVIRFKGKDGSMVTLLADSTAGSTPEVHINGSGTDTALQYTIMKDVDVAFRNGPQIDHCLFLHTQHSKANSPVSVWPGTRGAVFNQCDFIRVQTNAPGILIKDSTFADSAEAGPVIFRNCLFSQFSSPPGNGPLLESDNTGNITTKLLNCNLYSDGVGPDPLYNITNIDTTLVWLFDPQYADLGSLDFRLMDTSPLMDKSTDGSPVGALGVYKPRSKQNK